MWTGSVAGAPPARTPVPPFAPPLAVSQERPRAGLAGPVAERVVVLGPARLPRERAQRLLQLAAHLTHGVRPGEHLVAVPGLRERPARPLLDDPHGRGPPEPGRARPGP